MLNPLHAFTIHPTLSVISLYTGSDLDSPEFRSVWLLVKLHEGEESMAITPSTLKAFQEGTLWICLITGSVLGVLPNQETPLAPGTWM